MVLYVTLIKKLDHVSRNYSKTNESRINELWF